MITAGGNGPYYMLRPRSLGEPVTNHYLLAVLNHPLSEAFIRTHTSVFRGGYYSHGKQFLEDLPIPIPNNEQRVAVEGLVVELIQTLDAIALGRTPHQRTLLDRRATDLRGQIESRVSALFGLSSADVEIIRAVPIPI
jgi:hypothetical protein